MTKMPDIHSASRKLGFWSGGALAWRLLRSDPRGGALFFVTVALGVWILVGVVLAGDSLRARVEAETRAMLAADIRIEGAFPMDAWVATHLQRPGWTAAKSLEFNAMARSATGTASQLVEVKAVTAQYPLRGRVALRGGGELAAALHDGGVVVEAHLLERLHLRLGDRLFIGDAPFVIRAILEREPDRATRIFTLGPRIWLDLDRVPATHLIHPGSRVEYVTSLRLAPGEDCQKVAADLETRADAKGLRILAPGKKQPVANRFLGRLTIFMGLVAVMALLVGGLAIAGSVSAYMRERIRMVAILKCLGADNAMIFNIFFWHVLLMAGLGGWVGTGLGLATPWLLGLILGDGLTEDLSSRPHLLLAGFGLVLGIVLSLLFALGPLWETRKFFPGLLFRSVGWGEVGEGSLRSGWPFFLAGLPVVALAIFVAGEPGLALGFLGITVVALGVLRMLVWVIFHVLQGWHPRRPAWNGAVRALLRPENGSVTTITALGLGVSLVTTILLVQWDLERQIQTQLPKRVPALFFVDIQADQVAPFQQMVGTMVVDSDALRLTPVVRGRLTQVRQAGAAGDSGSVMPTQAWRFAREYVLTWSATLPPNNPILSGQWWRSPDENGVSVESGMARDLNLHLGDSLFFDIQGVVVEAPVRSIRQVTWSDMGLNFFVVFSPHLMQGAPGTWLASLALPPELEEPIYQATVRDFPNVTVIRAREVMETMQGVLEKLAHAVTALGALALISGLMVSWVSVHAVRKRRALEGAVYRLLGASRHEVTHMALLEFFLQGVAVATISLIVSQAMHVAVIHALLQDRWFGFPQGSLVVWCCTVVLLTLTGWLAIRHELRKPLQSHLFRAS
ncbi:MAG: ABC transporter permease [Magnetococcales bacterium]|nr:ABC transporter permease [Magnetococcales bacterium]MBF0322150.1 ABC transporter permease [Magnetococcales bacterium]